MASKIIPEEEKRRESNRRRKRKEKKKYENVKAEMSMKMTERESYSM
jgi:hypothetical protein